MCILNLGSSTSTCTIDNIGIEYGMVYSVFLRLQVQFHHKLSKWTPKPGARLLEEKFECYRISGKRIVSTDLPVPY